MRRKLKICFIIIALIGLLIAGTSTAYFTDSVRKALANFTVGTVEVEFEGHKIHALSEYVDEKSVTWKIKNTGKNAVFLRALPKFIDGHNNKEIKLEEKGITFDVGGNWIQGKDGDNYFYYDKSVYPTDDPVELQMTVYFEETFEPTKLNIDLEVEAVQESNNAIDFVWPQNPLKSK